MASTNKTPQLGLNQWAAGDPVLREDFNGDNGKIEAEFVKMRGEIVCGSYVGDSVSRREIYLGFKPSFIIVKGLDSGKPCFLFSFSGDGAYLVNAYLDPANNSAEFTERGFLAMNISQTNRLDTTYHYLAIR